MRKMKRMKKMKKMKRMKRMKKMKKVMEKKPLKVKKKERIFPISQTLAPQKTMNLKNFLSLG